ncbi:MAG: non-ribosomal peptide synthetase, partial [Bifidobacteriaceae bacterium]|nr:non-ribosomal peptide synthetase [Bifidobacteriaceae bacterium]
MADKYKELRPLELKSAEAKKNIELRAADKSHPKATFLKRYYSVLNEHSWNKAVIFDDISYSYEELEKYSNRFANYLKKHQNIAFQMSKNCLEPIIALACLKTGKLFIPLDIDTPKSRVEYILKASSADLFIVENDDGKTKNLSCITVETLREIIQDKKYDKPCIFSNLEADKESTALIMFTSGTTGEPKGVKIQVGVIDAICNYYNDYYALTPESRVALWTNYAFDVHFIDMFPTLASGAQLWILDEETRLDITKTAEFIRENAITSLTITTNIGAQLVTHLRDSNLKTLVLAGERFPEVEPEGDYKLFNCYGPTEAGGFTMYEVTHKSKSTPIGKCVFGSQIYILDEAGNNVPDGVYGEICASGELIANGYLGGDNEDKESPFIENPFYKYDGYKKMYKTGDIGRILKDGNAEYKGRADRQIKIGGQRIEISEVEKNVLSHLHFNSAAVIFFENQLHCFYVTNREKNPHFQNVLKKHIPEYMIPSSFIRLNDLPKNANGKIDYDKLPLDEIKLHKARLLDNVPPQTFTEERLYEIWKRVLKVDADFGINTNFFDLGG